MRMFSAIATWLFIHCMLVHAQSIDPQSFDFSGPTSDSSAVLRAGPRTFITGWNWGPSPISRALNESLLINASHTSLRIGTSATSIFRKQSRLKADGTRYIWGINRIAGNGGNAGIAYAWSIGMEFDPTLGSTIGTEERFTPRYQDTTGAVFGFGTRNLQIGTVPGPEAWDDPQNALHEDYNRFVLFVSDLESYNQDSSLPLTTPHLVLTDILPNNELLLDDQQDHADTFARFGLTEHIIKDSKRYPDKLQLFDIVDSVTRSAPAYVDTTIRGDDSTMFWSRNDSTEWYLTINVRRLNNDSFTGDTALSLRVPYIIRYDSLSGGTGYETLYARFDSVSIAADTIHHSTFGIMDKNLGVNNGVDTVFFITKAMLPPEVQGERNDITLSAYFRIPRSYRRGRLQDPPDDLLDTTFGATQIRWRACPTDSTDEVAMMILVDEYSAPPDPNDTLVKFLGVTAVDMEIYYHGAADIGIDWARFENRLMRQVLRGTKDDILEQIVQDEYESIDSANTDLGGWRNMTLYRQYLADETSAPFWRAQRYLSRRFENTGTIEAPWYFAQHYDHQTQANEQWKTWGNYTPGVAAPYIKYGRGHIYATVEINGETEEDVAAPFNKRRHRTMELRYGYRGYAYGGDVESDPDTFEYETHLPNGHKAAGHYPLFDASDSIYREALSNSGSYIQPMYEDKFAYLLYSHEEALYRNTDLWVNPWIHVTHSTRETNYDSLVVGEGLLDTALVYNSRRPQTGEEFNQLIWTGLIYGAKGLMYFLGGSKYTSSTQLGMSRAQVRRTNGVIDSTDHGGDYYDEKDLMWVDMEVKPAAHEMGLDSANPKLYIGSQTLRAEMRKVNTLLHDNNDEWMRLELLSTFDKGYKLYETQRDTSIDIQKYVSVSGFNDQSVRRLHDRQGNACAECYEKYKDSTFFVLNLHRDRDASTDSIFYLAIMNRRTDPTIYYPAGGGIDLGDSVRFYSTVEFDTLVANGDLTHYAEPQYAQHGAREITLPFSYTSQHGYALLHITELTASGVTGIDTVVGQDRSLAVKLQPGEGKMLRVKILHPNRTTSGELAYSNQRKIVARPLNTAGDTLVYHMAYHKDNPAVQGKRAVYYRRSLPVAANTDEENIIWEAGEARLGYQLWAPNILRPNGVDQLALPNRNWDCAYPSIVARYDSVSRKERVYVVYACKTEIGVYDSLYHVIAETVLDADEEMWKFVLGGPLNDGYAFASGNGEDLTQYGTPVVNAAMDHNIYAWADSLAGIGVGYKTPDEDTLRDQRYVHWADTVLGTWKHPSVNAYARIGYDENDCALVWEEDGQIYYTRPYVEADTVALFRMPLSGAVDSAFYAINTDSTVVRLSRNQCFTNTLPVLYRAIGPPFRYNIGGGDSVQFTHEFAFWQTGAGGTGDKKRIAHRKIFITDTVGAGSKTPGWWLMNARGNLWGWLTNLYQPDAAQGAYRPWSTTVEFNMSDSAVVLSLGQAAPGDNQATAGRIWHLPMSQWSEILQGNVLLESPALRYKKSVLENGQLAHQTARERFIQTDAWRENRRLFETGASDPPDVVATAQHYFKTMIGDPLATVFVGFVDGCTTIAVNSDAFKGSERVSFMRPKPENTNEATLQAFYFPDTVFTEWTSIGDNTDLTIYTIGTSATYVNLDLVRQSDGQRTPITLTPAATDSTAAETIYTLANGGGASYRLELYTTSASAEYAEHIVLGEIEVDDTTGGSEKRAARYINIAGFERGSGLHASAVQLVAYPNPADESLSVTAFRDYAAPAAHIPRRDMHLIIRLVTSLGQELARRNVRAGETAIFPTAHLAAGAYYVRVEEAPEFGREAAFNIAPVVIRR